MTYWCSPFSLEIYDLQGGRREGIGVLAEPFLRPNINKSRHLLRNVVAERKESLASAEILRRLLEDFFLKRRALIDPSIVDGGV